jgi:tetratricopeptide (TPR) repeat protein
MARGVRRALLAVIVVAVLGFLTLHVWLGWELDKIQRTAQSAWSIFSNGVRSFYDAINDSARILAPVVTILGGGYAIVHRWNYNKNRMQIHIDDFITRENERLRGSRDSLSKTLERPSPATGFAAPIFRKRRLQRTLKRMHWDRLSWFKPKLGPMKRADENLETELAELENQLKVWGKVQANYNERIAQAHLLRGAIAAARGGQAKAAGKDAWESNLRAFEHFEEAHKLNASDPDALEYMGHMRVRLGQYPEAIADFEALEKLAPKEGKTLARARALKFQAEVSEYRDPPRLPKANGLLNDALAALPEKTPPLEGAELYEMQGRVRKEMLPPQIWLTAGNNSYTAAAQLYQKVVDEIIKIGDRENISRANEGLARCRDALAKIASRQAQLLDDGNGDGNRPAGPPS